MRGHRRTQQSLPRRLRYALETVIVYILYTFFRILPLDAASGLGGWIGRSIGPHLPSSVTARKNLAMAFPEKKALGIESIVTGMWDNLGRVMGEYAHLHRIWDRVEVEGKEYLEAARDSGRPSIFFAGHIANWEVNAISAKKIGLDIHLIYRKPNNPGVDRLLRHARDSGASGHIEKGGSGAREMLSVLKKNGALGIMIDQKLNEGVPVPFFGRDAMTAPAIASFAFHFKCPVYPVRLERLQGAHFKITFLPPLQVPLTGNQEKDTLAMLTEMNRHLEDWIRQRPEQWLWIHRRWPE